MSDNNYSISQDDNSGAVDFDEILNEFSATAPDWTPPPPEDDTYTEDTQDAGDTAQGYWRSQLHTLPAFLQRPRKQWIVDNVFGEKDFVLLYGESGHGKTHVALDLAFSCATGRAFADVFTVARPLIVVYATGEGVGGLADRLSAVSHYYETPDVALYILTDIPQLFQHTQANGAAAFLHEWQAMAADGLVPATIDVLVLDTMHNATSGADENSAKDAGIVQASMRRLRDTLGCAVLLVHHAGKNGATERGSSAIRASADAVLRATKTGHSFTLACEKLKDGETWPAKSFSLVPDSVFPGVSVRVQWHGDAKTDSTDKGNKLERRVLAELETNAGRRYTADEVAEAINEDSRTSVQNTLKALRMAGAVLSEKERRTTRDGKERDVFVYWKDSEIEVSNEVS